jgi:hypothetical protein
MRSNSPISKIDKENKMLTSQQLMDYATSMTQSWMSGLNQAPNYFSSSAPPSSAEKSVSPPTAEEVAHFLEVVYERMKYLDTGLMKVDDENQA